MIEDTQEIALGGAVITESAELECRQFTAQPLASALASALRVRGGRQKETWRIAAPDYEQSPHLHLIVTVDASEQRSIVAVKPTITCEVSGEIATASLTRGGNIRLPRGWKSIGNQVLAPMAVESRYRLAAVIIPVAGPVIDESGLECEEDIKAARAGGWKTIDDALRESWQESTTLANWCLIELLKNDHPREQGGGKLPPMPPINLYSMRKGEFDGWSQSASAVMRTVEQNYRSYRGEMLGMGRRKLPDVRYPYPWPVHNTGWKAFVNDDKQPVVDIPTRNGRLQLQLRGGKNYRRQLASFRDIASGAAVKGELAVYARRGPGGRLKDYLVKMVAWLPRKTVNDERSGTLHVRTDSDSFLVALNADDDKLFVINGDEMRKSIRKHQRWLSRWREDQKLESRHPHRVRKNKKKPMQAGGEKHRNRLNSFVDEKAANVVNYAIRRKLSRIVYTDDDRGFFGDAGFPYFVFCDKLRQKCQRDGIVFERSADRESTGTARDDATQGDQQ